jgi:hypothetical protein
LGSIGNWLYKVSSVINQCFRGGNIAQLVALLHLRFESRHLLSKCWLQIWTCEMVCKVLWSPFFSGYIQYSRILFIIYSIFIFLWSVDSSELHIMIGVNKKILTYELDLVPSTGGYSFKTRFWAGHSICGGMPSLTDVNQRMDPTLGKMLVASLKLCNRGYIYSDSNGWRCLILRWNTDADRNT